ncbi:MAG: DUF5615 family PIN-like protein [Xenococcaceae cyanobacterium]
MSLRFFIDHCVPSSIAQIFRNANYEVFLLKDSIPIESTDSLVIATAQQLNAILVSVNGDFADIVTYPPANYRGIISLQLRNHPEIIPQLMNKLIDYLSAHNDIEYYQGKLLIAEVSKIRIRE